MRLFIASGIFHPESGGPATYLYEILPALVERGYEVRALTFADEAHGSLSYPYHVQRIIRASLHVRTLHYALAARPLMAWADLTYIHLPGLPLITLGLGHKPRVLKVVGDGAWERAVRKGWVRPSEDIDDFQVKAYDNIGVLSNQFQRAREARSMDAIIVPSEYLARMVAGWGVDERHIHVIYNALSSFGLPDLIQTEARKALNLPDAPTLLFVGRLTAWKGVDHLIAALGRVKIPDLHLLIAGDGDQRATLEKLAHAYHVAHRVTFLGNMPRVRVVQYMRAADYLALYSGYEGLSHTLLEALRVGTPVIASDKGGNPEVVVNGVNGLLVPFVNIEALIDAIETAFVAGVRERLAANTQVGLDRFTFARMVDQTDALLRTVVDSVAQSR